MKVASLIASRNRPDLVDALVERLARRREVPHDVYVAECGTDRALLSPHSTLWYADPDFRGKCYGHNVALRAALLADDYDYVFVLMNDVVFDGDADPVATLVAQMEAEPRLAVLSPTEVGSGYPAGAPRPGGGWRTVTTCDYLALMMRTDAIADAGFLNPDFRYAWGAIHELSYRLYSRRWLVGYSDAVSYRHLGGTTYGAAGTQTISRDDYQREARRFAARYFRETYGDDWHERFWRAAAASAPEVDTYALHRALWEGQPETRRAAEPPAPEPGPEAPAGHLVIRRPWRERRPGEGPPDFVGVGAMKAGTTRWFTLLAEHPEVFVPDPSRKELHFFDDLEDTRVERLEVDDYHRLFPRPEGMLAGEWTPSYMFLERVPPLLARAAPDAKLLAILRDPVERYRSGITHSAHRWGFLNDGWLRMHREIGFYARQLRRLFEHFPRKQVLVLQYERCVLDPRGELERTHRFLGLRDPGYAPPSLFDAIHRTEVEKLPLPPAARAGLAAAYRDDALQLEALVPGFDLSLWPSFAAATERAA